MGWVGALRAVGTQVLRCGFPVAILTVVSSLQALGLRPYLFPRKLISQSCSQPQPPPPAKQGPLNREGRIWPLQFGRTYARLVFLLGKQFKPVGALAIEFLISIYFGSIRTTLTRIILPKMDSPLQGEMVFIRSSGGFRSLHYVT